MYQTEGCISANSILSHVECACKALRLLIRSDWLTISDVDHQGADECLRHPLGGPGGLRRIFHGSTLPLTDDLVERSEEIRHKTRFAVVSYRVITHKMESIRTRLVDHAHISMVYVPPGVTGLA